MAHPARRVAGLDVRSAFARALDRVRKEQPDYLVLTGDLAQDKAPQTYQALRELLGELLDRTLVLPGNHDDPKRVRAAFPTCTGAPDKVGFSIRSGGWHLLGIDTHVPRRVLGRVGAAQLAWLAAELEAGTEPAIVFLHHPPIVVGTWWLDASRLEDAAPLAALLESHPRVQAVVCGHAHMDAAGRLGHAQVLVTPSTAYQFVAGALWPRVQRDGSAFRMFDLGEKLRTEVVRVQAG